MTTVRKCKNCFYWDKKSAKHGKCSLIGHKANLRLAKIKEVILFAMTPWFAVCDDHKYTSEIQTNEQETTE